MALSSEGIAASIFIVRYLVALGLWFTGYAQKLYTFKSRFSYLLAHAVVRLGAEGAALAFGITGTSNIGAFIAYLILGAQGYFVEILAAYRFLVAFQVHNNENGRSWIMPKFPKDTPRSIIPIVMDPSTGSVAIFQTVMRVLSLANILVIVGGALNANAASDPANNQGTLNTVKILRTVGQAVFLVINVIYLFLIIKVIQESRRQSVRTPHLHPALILLLLTWPVLCVRGVYGLLSGIDFDFSYVNHANYDNSGNLKSEFVAKEYILGVAMEWITFMLLLGTSLTTSSDLYSPSEFVELGKAPVYSTGAPAGYNAVAPGGYDTRYDTTVPLAGPYASGSPAAYGGNPTYSYGN